MPFWDGKARAPCHPLVFFPWHRDIVAAADTVDRQSVYASEIHLGRDLGAERMFFYSSRAVLLARMEEIASLRTSNEWILQMKVTFTCADER